MNRNWLRFGVAYGMWVLVGVVIWWLAYRAVYTLPFWLFWSAAVFVGAWLFSEKRA